MIYILDFDGVLFDDKRFKSDFRRVFGRHGVTHNAYEQTYRQAKEAKRGAYGIDTHLAVIHHIYPRVDISGLRRDLFVLAGHSRRYIFVDAKTFLVAAQKRGDKLFLLSTGDKLFQETKINASGIVPFLNNVFIATSSRKASLFAKIKKQAGRRETVFIDDKREVVDEIKKHNPNVRVVQMVRGAHVVKSDYVDTRIKNFIEFI